MVDIQTTCIILMHQHSACKNII